MKHAVIRNVVFAAVLGGLATLGVSGAWGQTYTTNYVWDGHRRVTMIVRADPDGPGGSARTATRTTYDADGQVIQVELGTTTLASGADFAPLQRTTFVYDGAGRRVRETSYDGVTSTAVTVVQTEYDDADRPTYTAVRLNPAVFGSLPADAHTLSAPGVFGPDRISRTVYDAAGQVTSEVRAFGTALQQTYVATTYSLNGRPTSQTDANGNTTTISYDGFDRVQRLYFPPSPSALDYEEYGYDANDNRTSLRRRSGESVTFAFDALDRRIVLDEPGGSTSDVYSDFDLADSQLFARYGSAGGSGIDAAYDAAGRRVTEATNGRSISFQYDRAGNVTRVTWPDGFFAQYAYDATNHLVTITENGSVTLASYVYDGLGRLSGETSGNGAIRAQGYDLTNRVTSLALNVPSGADFDVTFNFTYTPANDIRQRIVSNDAYIAGLPARNINYQHNNLNQYTQVAGATFTYDARGNLTSDGVRTFTYDLDNHLLSVSGIVPVSLTYDPLGRLLSTSSSGATTEYLYSGNALIAEYSASSGALLRRYVHPPGEGEPVVWYEGAGTTDRRWLLRDNQGTVVATMDGSGAGLARYTYGAYGEPDSWGSAGGASRFRYTGQIALFEARLYHLGARAYDPVLGRFLQTDPSGYRADYNLYAYVANDPVNLEDPTGECPLELCLGSFVTEEENTGGRLFAMGMALSMTRNPTPVRPPPPPPTRVAPLRAPPSEPAGAGLRPGSLVNGSPSAQLDNCGNCVFAMAARLHGVRMSAAPSVPLRFRAPGGGTSIASIERTFGTSFSQAGMSRSQIISAMQSAGSGRVGVVLGERAGGRMGHVFIVVNQRGVIRFIDPQTGREAQLAGQGYIRTRLLVIPRNWDPNARF